MYLAVVLDLFSHKVVGWLLSDSPDTALILAALNQAVVLRQVSVSSGVLFHSDQGCQYTSHAYQDRLTELGIKASMSRRDNCWDNAVMERFFTGLTDCPNLLDHYNKEPDTFSGFFVPISRGLVSHVMTLPEGKG